MSQPAVSAPRAELLGGDVDLVTCADVMDFVANAAEAGRKAIVANHNLHSLYLVKKSPAMADFFSKADLIEIDSMPMILWGKMLGLPVTPANRCTYLDWRDQFWAMASQRRWKVFYLGGKPGVAQEAARRLMQRWPGVEIVTHHGYFDRKTGSAANSAVIAQINACRPHVLMVGMGMPIQETWIADNFEALESGVVLPVGAAFDYEAGVQVPAPRMLGTLGVEWLFRLICHPTRLFSRYLIEPWALVRPAMTDLSRSLSGKRMVTPPPQPDPDSKGSKRDAFGVAA